MEKVVLVSKNNRKVGEEEKLKAHEKGLLHRAFSVFVFNKKGEFLLQKRNLKKYHSGGLWSNTVCSHPRVDERYLTAVHRRLLEEMGFDCKTKKIGSFIYKSKFDDGLIENEYDTVFVGEYDGEVKPNPEEIENIRWAKISALKNDIKERPQDYTFWFKKIIDDGLFDSYLNR